MENYDYYIYDSFAESVADQDKEIILMDIEEHEEKIIERSKKVKKLVEEMSQLITERNIMKAAIKC